MTDRVNRAAVVADAQSITCGHGEGVFYDPRDSENPWLIWLDMEAKQKASGAYLTRLWFLHLETGQLVSTLLPCRVGKVLPWGECSYLAVGDDGIFVLNHEGCVTDERSVKIPFEDEEQINDVGLSPEGFLFPGSMNKDPSNGDEVGCVWKLDEKGKLHKVVSGLVIANGQAFIQHDGVSCITTSLARGDKRLFGRSMTHMLLLNGAGRTTSM